MKKAYPIIVCIAIVGAFAHVFTACESTRQSPDILLKDDVAFLASDSQEGRETGSAGERRAAAYISDRFKTIGLTPAGTNGYYQEFIITPAMNPHEVPAIGEEGDTLAIVANNIIGLMDSPGNDIIVIGAHYDHLGYGGSNSLYRGDSLQVHNGADDNASGVAVMLLLAQQLSKKKISSDIVFMAFSGEEKGLWGSNYFSKNPTLDITRISAMINLDMVGRFDEKKGLAIHGTGTSPSWEEIIHRANTDSLQLLFRPSGVGPSDHTSFYLQNIPVLHFFTGQHEDYHKPGDDAEKLNYEGMEKIALLIERIAGEVAGREKLVFTKTKDESTATPRFTVTLGVIPDYLYNGVGMKIDGVSEGKPAQAAGLMKGDIIIRLGDYDVTDMMSYMKALSGFSKGEETTVVVNRQETMAAYTIKF